MKITRLLLPDLLLLALATGANAPDLVGKWHAEFDSQIGAQKYDYVFTQAGDKLDGKATYDTSMGKGESPLKDLKVSGSTVTPREVVYQFEV